MRNGLSLKANWFTGGIRRYRPAADEWGRSCRATKVGRFLQPAAAAPRLA
ncbi:hypothetical protein RISK_001534 [Rhodopirellula islandica]|uniref:Uncharacterized protein n=1 Tax=Rhodopirellula islandica TaxID=595434 RepID=A0A0J1BIM0_RHOIS|nr:hypothetical protein RISK_001534 [Rhodopirellula islandica]